MDFILWQGQMRVEWVDFSQLFATLGISAIDICDQLQLQHTTDGEREHLVLHLTIFSVFTPQSQCSITLMCGMMNAGLLAVETPITLIHM
jgi:hypothetical protein